MSVATGGKIVKTEMEDLCHIFNPSIELDMPTPYVSERRTNPRVSVYLTFPQQRRGFNFNGECVEIQY